MLLTNVYDVNSQQLRNNEQSSTKVYMAPPKPAAELTAGFPARLKTAVERAQTLASAEQGKPPKQALSYGKIEVETRLSDGYLSKLLAGQRTNPSVDYVVSLADFLGVRLEWLATGRGEMLTESTDPVVVRDRRYHNLDSAAQCARELGYPVEAIDLVERTFVAFKGDDLPQRWWFEQIQEAAKNLAHGRAPKIVSDLLESDVRAELERNARLREEPPIAQPSITDRLAAAKAQMAEEEASGKGRRRR